jgi:hypothetical protein
MWPAGREDRTRNIVEDYKLFSSVHCGIVLNYQYKKN